jgi:hypothetical protein
LKIDANLRADLVPVNLTQNGLNIDRVARIMAQTTRRVQGFLWRLHQNAAGLDQGQPKLSGVP